MEDPLYDIEGTVAPKDEHYKILWMDSRTHRGNSISTVPKSPLNVLGKLFPKYSTSMKLRDIL